MRALYLKDTIALTDRDCPIPGRGEALVKVHMAGICNTDLELVKGYMGFEGVLGHEFVGVVEEADDPVWHGKRVCGEINFGCGKCNYCDAGLGRHCPQRTVLGILNQNGAFADYVLLPIKNMHEVPDSISDSTAVFVEPLAAALEILEQVKIEPDHSVAVIGDGKLGLLICQVLILTGCDVLLIGKHPKKLTLARSWGMRTCVYDNLPKCKKDIVVEASGAASGFETALALVRPRGRIVLKSTYHGNLEFNAAPIVIDEITIIGSRCGPFAAAIRVLQNKLVDVEGLVEDIYPFEQAIQALVHAGRHNSLKVLLQMH
ncbi:MAG: alcohol dehydrogenase catalytic domain-containing protein [bacterium]